MIPVKVCVSCHEMSGYKNIITRSPGYFTYSGSSSSRLSDLLYFTCLSSHESHSPVITWHTVCWSVSLCGRQSCYWSRFCRESWVQVNFSAWSFRSRQSKFKHSELVFDDCSLLKSFVCIVQCNPVQCDGLEWSLNCIRMFLCSTLTHERQFQMCVCVCEND